MSRKLTMDELIERAKNKFGSFMNYSLVDKSLDRLDIVTLECPIHGKIKITMTKHLEAKTPCYKCYRDSLNNSSSNYIKNANKVHNFKYTYKNVMKNTIEVICPFCGLFTVNRYKHLKGKGCPTCEKKFKIEELKTRISKKQQGYKIQLEGLALDSIVSLVCNCGFTINTRVKTALDRKLECPECKINKKIEI